MTNQSLARSYLIKAQKRLKALAVLRDEGAHSDVVREAQELVRSDVQDLDDIPLRIELVGEQELLGPHLEFHDANPPERPRLGFAGQRVREVSPVMQKSPPAVSENSPPPPRRRAAIPPGSDLQTTQLPAGSLRLEHFKQEPQLPIIYGKLSA